MWPRAADKRAACPWNRATVGVSRELKCVGPGDMGPWLEGEETIRRQSDKGLTVVLGSVKLSRKLGWCGQRGACLSPQVWQLMWRAAASPGCGGISGNCSFPAPINSFKMALKRSNSEPGWHSWKLSLLMVQAKPSKPGVPVPICLIFWLGMFLKVHLPDVWTAVASAGDTAVFVRGGPRVPLSGRYTVPGNTMPIHS